VSFTVEDLARTALIRILPRSRYRLAAQNDSRFQAFVPNVARIAYRQQGATPAFLLFSGPGQDPRAAALSAAAVAEATWRPNAIQRTVRPGVVVVQVAPGPELAQAGPVAGSAVPAAIWTVDSETGRVEVAGKPPGSPSGGEVQRAAAALVKGVPPPSLGELDLAERAVMQVRTRGVPPRVMAGAFGLCLVIFALRYGFAGLFSLMALPSLLSPGPLKDVPYGAAYIYANLILNVLLLLGILLGAGLLFNIRNLAYRAPGFSSPVPRTRSLTWGGYIVAMVALAVVLDGVLPSAEQANLQSAQRQQDANVTVTIDDDGSDAYVAVGGQLTVDLSGWPQSEWSSVEFKTSNPSVLALSGAPAAAGPPLAHFSANEVGASRIDATSPDGRYTFEVRVTVDG
jgi:hypothetical protein